MLIQQLVVSFLATAAFGIIFSAPKRLLIAGGGVGMIGWLIYIEFTRSGIPVVPATLVAAFMITLVSLLFARFYKAPVTVFSVAGIIPLVPGGLAYNAMRYFVENDYNLAMRYAAESFMISGAIAIGLIVAEVVYQIVKRQPGAF
ncbi:threonine/serine exporter family protein [Alicyclobacillus ferrooxydans]|uniref:Threonine/Serine exporter ThrE domain-containing protein n=1 Tax=Alicyclobacillus ferrooxydans TaxID=471514 RepID=A0A0P9C9R2_9BACL|nr:threonine/serine exporter family protein [Alicyclobacillus ferrooxydans]KPV42119.1 hypothetical protein AN477_18880 [Alicyclobacillus ferrooxydans]